MERGASWAAGALGLAMAATALLPPTQWPWLLGTAVALFAAALIVLLLLRYGCAVDGRLAVLAAGAAAFGLAALTCADPRLNGLPHAPALSPLLGWPPALSFALGAVGLFRLSTAPEDLAGRRLLGAGGLLLVLAALFPQVTAGSLTLPVLAAWGSGALDGLLTVALAGTGGAFLVLAMREQPPAAKALRTYAIAALAMLPCWHLLHVLDGGWPCLVRALWTAACTVTVAFSIEHVLRGETRGLAAASEWSAVVLLSVLYWLLKQQGLGYAAADEGIYFYAAKLWADGVWPYRDFFFAHPPVQLIAPALLDKVIGFSYVGSKLMAPLAGFGAGLVLWRSTRKHFGAVAGVSALGLFWLAAEVLKSTTTFTGAETATLFLCLGVAAALDRRSLLAGVWFGLASATAIYASSGFLAFALLFLLVPRDAATKPWWKRHDAARLVAAFLLTFGAINLVFYAIGGGRYLDGVYRYHLLKAAKDPNQQSFLDGPGAIVHNVFALLDSHELRVFLAYHAVQVWLALLAPILLFARHRVGRKAESLWPPSSWWRSSDGRIVVLLLGTIGSLVTLAQLNERYDYYFMIVFPTLVPLAGCTVAELVRWADAALPRAQPAKKRAATGGAMQWPWAAAAMIAAALWLPLNAWANAAAFPEEITARGSSRGAGEVLSFDWTPAPLWPALGEVVHALFWSDTRVRGDLESSIHSYLFSKKRTFSTAPQIAEYIRDHTGPDDTITGGSDYAPLIALLAGRRLAGNQIDTNSKVFRTGIISEQEFWTRVCKDRPAYVISAEMSYFAPENLRNLPTVANDFQLEQEFTETLLKYRRGVPIRLLRRKHDPPYQVCNWYWP